MFRHAIANAVWRSPGRSFQLCGSIGFSAALLLGIGFALLRGLSPLVVAALWMTSILTFLALAMATKIVAGEERLVYYHHQIAVTAAAALMLRVSGRPVVPYLDILAVGLGLCLACGRIGCLAAGCCHGRPSRFGIRYREVHVRAGFPRHLAGVRLAPVQAFESAAVLTLAALAAAVLLSGAPAGSAFAVYISGYAAVRFFLEFLRGDACRCYWWRFSEAQWTSLLLVFLVAALQWRGLVPLSVFHVLPPAIIAVAAAFVREKPLAAAPARNNAAPAAPLSVVESVPVPSPNGHHFSRISVFAPPVLIQRMPAGPETETTAEEPAPEAAAGESTPGPSPNGHHFSRISVFAPPVLIQRMPAGPETETTAEEPAPGAAAGGLIVEDDSPEAANGRMRKTEFLTALYDALCGIAATEAGSVCPGIDELFGKYGDRPAADIESMIRRHVAAAGVSSAIDYIPLIGEVVRRAVLIWMTTGAVTGIPPELESDLPVEPPGPRAGPEPAPPVARKGRDSGMHGGADSPGAIQSQLGVGRSLDSAIQARLAPVTGMDLSRVRIHTDATAARLSDRLDARAFTVGRHIAFAPGEFQPGTPVGDALLAHELAHVAQQNSDISRAATDSAAYTALEQDADQSAIGTVLSLWGWAGAGLGNLRANSLPALKSGLRLQRCCSGSSGPIGTGRATTAKDKFRKKNDQLSTAELDKIDSALSKTTSGNLDLIISFYDYFSCHAINKDPDVKAKGLDGDTKPNSDMNINPDRLDPTTSDTRLGATLLHEFSHTRHDQNPMGLGDFQEGDSYGIEYFFAERNGETARTKTIQTLVSTPGKLSIPRLHPALVQRFKLSYATLVALYEVIDGKTPRAGVTGLTADDARRLAARLVDTPEGARPADLQKVMTWVQGNLPTFTLPVP